MQGKAGTGISGKYQGRDCRYGHGGMRYRAGGSCVECRKIYSTTRWHGSSSEDDEWRRRKRENSRRIYPTTLRNRALKKHYGITLEQYNEMLSAQNDRCALCGTEKNGKTFHVDHDHKTGKVRGILCYKCNVGLGSFDDDTKRLRKAINYLHKHRK